MFVGIQGYIYTDTPAFDIRKAQEQLGRDWVSTMRCLPPHSPGRLRYTAFIQRRYAHNLTAVCDIYQRPSSDCATWDSLNLCGADNTAIPAVLADDYLFLPEIVESYYIAARASIKSCDPQALIWGDTIRVEWTPDNVIEMIARHVDAISFQPSMTEYDPAVFSRLHNLTGGKPIIIADIGFGWPRGPPYNNTEWHKYSSQQAAGRAYQSFAVQAAQSGYVVGVNKCEYIDRFLDQPGPVLKPGQLHFDGTPHEPFTSIVRAANKEVQRVFSARKP